MKIRNVVHKGLSRFIETGSTAGIQPESARKLLRVLAFLQEMESEAELHTVPMWRAHPLTGSRRGTWSLSVTRNWRITFRIDFTENEIINLNYEDYH